MRLKRAFDVLAAAAALVVTCPLWPIVALLIRSTSPGPVLHRAVRIGKDGVPFTLLKFRSMRVADEGSGITASGDPRITVVGKVLRRTKLDELPQLINVLRGEMSLVGPRPEDPRYVAGYSNEQRGVLSVRPGITSPASLAYRDEERLIASRGGDPAALYREEILPAKLSLDLAYVEERTFWTDVATLLRTALGILLSPRRSGSSA